MSYAVLWPKAFHEHPDLNVFPINLFQHGYVIKALAFYMKKIFRPDIIVFLHSAFSNDLAVPEWFIGLLADINAKKIFFITNTYKNMPKKMDFCERIGVNILVQLGTNTNTAKLYQTRLPGVVVANSHAGGLDERLFNPGHALEKRPIDIGFRGDPEPY